MGRSWVILTDLGSAGCRGGHSNFGKAGKWGLGVLTAGLHSWTWDIGAVQTRCTEEPGQLPALELKSLAKREKGAGSQRSPSHQWPGPGLPGWSLRGPGALSGWSLVWGPRAGLPAPAVCHSGLAGLLVGCAELRPGLLAAAVAASAAGPGYPASQWSAAASSSPA